MVLALTPPAGGRPRHRAQAQRHPTDLRRHLRHPLRMRQVRQAPGALPAVATPSEVLLARTTAAPAAGSRTSATRRAFRATSATNGCGRCVHGARVRCLLLSFFVWLRLLLLVLLLTFLLTNTNVSKLKRRPGSIVDSTHTSHDERKGWEDDSEEVVAICKERRERSCKYCSVRMNPTYQRNPVILRA